MKRFCLLAIFLNTVGCGDSSQNTAPTPPIYQPFDTQVQALRDAQQLEQQMQDMEAERRRKMEEAGM